MQHNSGNKIKLRLSEFSVLKTELTNMTTLSFGFASWTIWQQLWKAANP